jgi:hypothetical protein
MAQKNIVTSNGGQQVLGEDEVDSILMILLFSVKDFFSWWYINMAIWHLKMLGRISLVVDDNMSISLLLRNFFVPWHRDNSMIGWVFGILIKLVYLPIAILGYLLACIFYILLILIWFVLPPGTLLFVFKSLLSF